MREQTEQGRNPVPDPAASSAGSGPRAARLKFPPEARIRKKSEYAAVFNNSRKVADRHFVCYLATQEQQGKKLGLAVSRKCGNAVTRNRIKRHIREFFRTRQHRIKAPCRIVVVARPPAAGLGGAACGAALESLLRRAELLDG